MLRLKNQVGLAVWHTFFNQLSIFSEALHFITNSHKTRALFGGLVGLILGNKTKSLNPKFTQGFHSILQVHPIARLVDLLNYLYEKVQQLGHL